MGYSSNLAGVPASLGEDERVRSSKLGVIQPRRGAPPSSLSLPTQRSLRSALPSKRSAASGSLLLNSSIQTTTSPNSLSDNQLPSTTPVPLKLALRTDSSSHALPSRKSARGAMTTSRTVTFHHHLFQPSKYPVKTTFQPHSDPTIEPSILSLQSLPLQPPTLQCQARYYLHLPHNFQTRRYLPTLS